MEKPITNIFVSSNGRTGHCRRCGKRNVALGDVAFPNGQSVSAISCPLCIVEDGMLQARISVSIGFSTWPKYPLAEYQFVMV